MSKEKNGKREGYFIILEEGIGGEVTERYLKSAKKAMVILSVSAGKWVQLWYVDKNEKQRTMLFGRVVNNDEDMATVFFNQYYDKLEYRCDTSRKRRSSKDVKSVGEHKPIGSMYK